MYNPPAFRVADVAHVQAMMAAVPLANLVTQTADGLMASPVPLYLDPAEGPHGTLYGHLARGNPQATAASCGEALAIFMGPDAYVSPGWYETKRETGKVVPTWNYATVHAYGIAEFFTDRDRLLAVVRSLTDRHEAARPSPWAVSDAPDDYIASQLKGIIGIRMPISRLEGKRKLSQNRSAADQAGVMAGLAASDAASDQLSPNSCRRRAVDDPTKSDLRDVATLIAIMKALRTPVTGCPWDLEQDFASIAPYTIEEAYEVADAISRGDKVDLAEELGDLLLQVVYHAQMATEEGSFSFPDVVEAICRKMIRRHPHVFGSDEARSAGVAKGFWEEIKAKERKEQPARTLDGIPPALPALTRALKLQAKAARVGFDWPDKSFVLDKIEEEIREFRAASSAEQKGELGDILFALANLARHLEIDPEDALRSTNDKFTRRFAYIEDQLKARGKTPKASNLAEMDALWDEAKLAERG